MVAVYPAVTYGPRNSALSPASRPAEKRETQAGIWMRWTEGGAGVPHPPPPPAEGGEEWKGPDSSLCHLC